MNILKVDRCGQIAATVALLYSVGNAISSTYGCSDGCSDGCLDDKQGAQMPLLIFQGALLLFGLTYSMMYNSGSMYDPFKIRPLDGLSNDELDAEARVYKHIYEYVVINEGSYACACYTCVVSIALDIWTPSLLKNIGLIAALFYGTKKLFIDYANAVCPDYKGIIRKNNSVTQPGT